MARRAAPTAHWLLAGEIERLRAAINDARSGNPKRLGSGFVIVPADALERALDCHDRGWRSSARFRKAALEMGATPALMARLVAEDGGY